MKVADLSPETLAKIKPVQWDRILEKHEGPDDWDGEFRYGNPEFLMVEGHPVLLPVDQSQHLNITVLRSIFSHDGNSITLFLQDTTYGTDWCSSGYVAVCDKVAGESFFLAILYHAWFVIERSPIFNDP